MNHDLYAEYALIRSQEPSGATNDLTRLLGEMVRAVRLKRAGSFATTGDWYREATAALEAAGWKSD